MVKLVVYATLYTKVIISLSKLKTKKAGLFLQLMYKLIRSILFLADPEKVHYFSMGALKLACKTGLVKRWLAKHFTPSSLRNKAFSLGSLQFKNPVGLGAGFDKNAKYLRELEVLGFGFIEIGTVTPLPQAGNDKPRLFRLPLDKALINRMGFNNDGVEAITERLRKWSVANEAAIKANSAIQHLPNMFKPKRLIIGGNIGKNKITPNENAWQDYEVCFTTLYPYVDYFVVNVSSPNTPGLRELQEKDALRKILVNLQDTRLKLAPTFSSKPILLKIAPDLTLSQIDDVIALALEIKLDGLVAANTTIDRSALVTTDIELQKIGAGGLSGYPLKQRRAELVNYICNKTKGQLPVIASGGIFNGADAKESFNAGACLVQVWTGFIYEGPSIVTNICNALQ